MSEEQKATELLLKGIENAEKAFDYLKFVVKAVAIFNLKIDDITLNEITDASCEHSITPEIMANCINMLHKNNVYITKDVFEKMCKLADCGYRNEELVFHLINDDKETVK